jgi:arsenate reductase
MAEGIMRHMYGERFEVFSAGTQPTSVNPNAVKVLQEIGIDISDHSVNNVTEFLSEDIDYVITVCGDAKETCPVFYGGKERLHHGFEDPSRFAGSEEKTLEVFRRVRDEIGKWIETYFEDK